MQVTPARRKTQVAKTPPKHPEHATARRARGGRRGRAGGHDGVGKRARAVSRSVVVPVAGKLASSLHAKVKRRVVRFRQMTTDHPCVMGCDLGRFRGVAGWNIASNAVGI